MPSNSKPAALWHQRPPPRTRDRVYLIAGQNMWCRYGTTKLCIAKSCITLHMHPHKQLELQPLTATTCYSSSSPVNTPCLYGFACFHLIFVLIVVERCSWENIPPCPIIPQTHSQQVTYSSLCKAVQKYIQYTCRHANLVQFKYKQQTKNCTVQKF